MTNKILTQVELDKMFDEARRERRITVLKKQNEELKTILAKQPSYIWMTK